MQSFLYINNSIEFQESTGRSVLVSACVLELDKVSQQNTEYRISEGNRISRNLVGKNVFYGIDFEGKHAKGEPVGFIENAWQTGRRIMAEIRIHNSKLVERIKRGVKFLFSVGGVAQFIEVVKKAGRSIRRMVDVAMSHLQLVEPNTQVGFPNAKLERVLEINESILLVDETGLKPDELVLLHVNLSMF